MNSMGINEYLDNNYSINQYLDNNNYACRKNAKYEYRNVSRIIAIGDLHGDFGVLRRCLEIAKVIDRRGDWIGGDTHVVQVGDILDGGGRGIEYESDSPYEEFKIYDYLNFLNSQAQRDGGAVHYMIGNHELMNLMGNFDYVHPAHMLAERNELFRPGSYLSQMLACHSYAVLVINGWVFCHAGLLPQHLEKHTIRSLNQLLRSILLGEKNIHNLSDYEDWLINSKESVFWNRQYVNNDNRCDMLDKMLKAIKGRGMVVGHTVHDKITSICNDRMFFIDLGMSKSFGGNLYQVLEIKRNGTTRVLS